MGMDVYGRKPTGKEGEYFRNNVWYWRPLADYIKSVAPDLHSKCKYWQSNDGDGLNAKDSLKLADRLAAELASGRTAEYAGQYAKRHAEMPDEDCDLCEGTGIRQPIPYRGAGDPKKGGITCNACQGKKTVRPSDTYYPFEVSNVRDFIQFLRACGGFKIN